MNLNNQNIDLETVPADDLEVYSFPPLKQHVLEEVKKKMMQSSKKEEIQRGWTFSIIHGGIAPFAVIVATTGNLYSSIDVNVDLLTNI